MLIASVFAGCGRVVLGVVVFVMTSAASVSARTCSGRRSVVAAVAIAAAVAVVMVAGS